ncbi:MAG: phospholipase D-like domain-containing protein [Granulosicoccus sp.]
MNQQSKNAAACPFHTGTQNTKTLLWQLLRSFYLLLIIVLGTGLSACAALTSLTGAHRVAIAPLNDELLGRYASVPELSIAGARVLTDNDDAFLTKLDLIRQANSSIDLAYYIFDDDYSSSLMARELIAATERGLRVRMLLDYHSHYKNTDYFLMLERYGNTGDGSLDVRFYNRPSQHIVKDAVYLTLGCGDAASASQADCSEAKFLEIEQLFAKETIDGEPASRWNISNINTGGSGLFLSGLYAKNPELMAMAVSNGQNIDIDSLQSNAGSSTPEDTEQLKQLARLYWLANYGSGLDRLVNRLKLSTAFLLYGEQLDPVYNTFTAWLPVERPGANDQQDESIEQARSDWRFISDFLHHKILLADQQQLVLGGRNVQDSYHMNASPLSAKYTFMDTDVHVQLTDAQNALTESFDKLWHFRTMVASLQEVNAHAPIDFLVNSAAAAEACQALAQTEADTHQACLDQALSERREVTPAARHQQLFNQMNDRAQTYEENYLAIAADRRSPAFDVEQDAQVYYIENLPFDKSLSAENQKRLYGASNGQEHRSGKNIHALWLSALKRSCQAASADEPVNIYLHNAYFFIPSNLLSALAQMTDGRWPCAHVRITVLTNSIETTDLNVVNLLSRHAMKALFEHYAIYHSPSAGATLEYVEYIRASETENNSLHSKVMIFGKDIYIGSANADLRSYLMDTNNGVFIRNAPAMVDAYTTWIDEIVADSTRAVNRNAEYLSTDRAQIQQADEKMVDDELAKYRAERFISDPEQITQLKSRLQEATDEVYRLSKKIVADPSGSLREQRRFNELFKVI